MTDRLWDIFGKRLVDLTLDEVMVLVILTAISFCLLAIAFSFFLQVARRLGAGEVPKPKTRVLRKALGRVSELDYPRETTNTGSA